MVLLESGRRASANVVGLGLIGGSVALALQARGFEVWGSDEDPGRTASALEKGIISHSGVTSEGQVTFVATPVGSLSRTVAGMLRETRGVVTDVGSVKQPVADSIKDPRFVPGHPMAGSELDGLDGADASMFQGAVWVLTPNEESSDASFAYLAELISGFGAEVVALEAKKHDELVAIVSHVPHLLASTLMGIADERADEHMALLRLAAGGFRDMTRIASGRPGIWLDICDENRASIISGIDAISKSLAQVKEIIARGDRVALFERLERARKARMNLPTRAGSVEDLCEVRIPIPDRPGSAAEVFALSGELGVNISDFEVVHSAEGDRGVMVVIIRAEQADVFRGGLLARKFKPSVAPLS